MVRSVSTWVRFGAVGVFSVGLVQIGTAQCGENALPAQPEQAVDCDEINDPFDISYGQHTSGCTISPAADLDSFDFQGVAGEIVRICVNRLGGQAEVGGQSQYCPGESFVKLPTLV